jgi:hypothetical protein
MHPVLSQILASVETLLAESSADRLAGACPGSWSGAGTLEHLALAYGGTTRMLYWLRDRNAVMPGKRGERQQQMIDCVLGEGNFPSGQAAPPFAQPTGLAPVQAAAKLRESLFELDAALTLLEKTFGSDSFLGRHPVLGPLTAGDWRRFHQVHTLHHLEQIRLRIAAADFQPTDPAHAKPGSAPPSPPKS